MKSDDITVQQLFQDRRQYMVPFYQRTYVWTRADQWEQLWEDIRVKAEDRLFTNKVTPHFLGAVVLDPQPKSGLIGVDTLHIIDGQQRLTTLQFVLKSILFLLDDVGLPAISQLVANTLFNGNPDTMRNSDIEVFKVWPTFRNRSDYRSAIQANDREELKTIFPDSFTQRETIRRIGINHPPALEAIWFFTSCFEKWISEDNNSKLSKLETLATSILQDLKVVSIVLDEEDDAQVIFETLNGRGAQLNSTDLIRNFIFMRADREQNNSENLYNEYWAQYENEYWNGKQRRGRIVKPKIEWFIHAAIQAELRDEVDIGRLYFEYRNYVFSGNEAKLAREQLGMLSNYSEKYRELVDRDRNSPISVFGKKIAPYDITTIHPLALFIATSLITEEEQSEIFTVLMSYVVRRAVCGLTTKNYNNIFISMLRSLSKEQQLSTDGLKNWLISLKGDAARWPRDEEFKNAFVETSIYPGSLDAPKMRSVLAEIELKLREQVRTEEIFSGDLTKLDIDHILPTSWYDHWPLTNGTVVNKGEAAAVEIKKLIGAELDKNEASILRREQRIPTLGNLTLLNLSVNREAQHKSFDVKKKLLIENTNLRLNIPLLSMKEWNEETIKERGEKLASSAMQIWPGVPA